MTAQIRSLQRGCIVAALVFGCLGAYLLWGLRSPLIAPPINWQSTADVSLFIFAKAQNEIARLGIGIGGGALLTASGLFAACFESLRRIEQQRVNLNG